MKNPNTESVNIGAPSLEDAPKTVGIGTASLVSKADNEEKKLSLDSWYYLIISYLSIAKLGISHIRDDGLEENRNLIIPTLFNLKHTIEIVLKYFCLSNGVKFELGHDIEKLVKDFRKSKEIKKKDNPDEYDAFKDLLIIAKRYATLDTLTSKFGQFQIRDGKNDIFRYPDGSAEVKRLDYAEFSNNLELVDINNIYDDIKLLENVIEVLKDYFNSDLVS